MKKDSAHKCRIVSLISTCIVIIYLVVMFTEPIGSLALLLGSVIVSVIGFAFAIAGFIKERTRFSIILLVLSSIAMTVILAVFLIMLAMGA